MSQKLISVCVPVYNEKDALNTACERITAVMRECAGYDYEIVFFDDGSTDGSDKIIEALCERDPHVKAVIYRNNIGYAKNVFYCAQQAKGDAAVIMHCDLQNPPEEIPNLIAKWEEGADIVLGVKNKSKENKLVYFLRTVCYWILNTFFGMRMVPHATEFELFDKSFIDVLKEVRTQNPYLRGLVKEYGRNIEKVYYVQDKRRTGKSHFNLSKYYDFAVGAIVSRSKCLPRRLIFLSLLCAVICCAEFIFHFLPRAAETDSAVFWNGVFIRLALLALLALTVIVSLLFEYVIRNAENAERKPFVTEYKRIGY